MNVVVKENDAKSILNATYNYDIRFKNETTLDDQKPLLTKEKIQAICKISGVKSVESVTSTEAVVPYQKEVYGEFYNCLLYTSLHTSLYLQECQWQLYTIALPQYSFHALFRCP